MNDGISGLSGLSGVFGDALGALRALITNEWNFDEGSATADALDSVGGITMTKANNPGVVSQGRSYASASSQQFTRTADNNLAQISGPNFGWSFWINIQSAPANGTIYSVRNSGSADGNLTTLARITAGTNHVQLFVGKGDGTFGNIDLGAVTMLSSQYIFFGYDGAGTIYGSLNGGAFVTGAGNTPTTLPATPVIGFGGNGGEYGDLWSLRYRRFSRLLTLAEVNVDMNDPRGL